MRMYKNIWRHITIFVPATYHDIRACRIITCYATKRHLRDLAPGDELQKSAFGHACRKFSAYGPCTSFERGIPIATENNSP